MTHKNKQTKITCGCRDKGSWQSSFQLVGEISCIDGAGTDFFLARLICIFKGSWFHLMNIEYPPAQQTGNSAFNYAEFSKS